MRRAAALMLLAVACTEETSAPLDASVPQDVSDGAVADAPVADVLDASVTDAAPACATLSARAIGIGWNHALAIGRDGALWSWGANGSGQLGLGDVMDRGMSTRVSTDGGAWRVVTGGSRHSCGIREDGSLWCWGVNVHGQLGVGDTRDRNVPTRVGVETDWVEVVCGGLHSCGIRAGGALWCWGANPAGQLGLGDQTGDRSAPQRVGTETGWRALAAKARFNCALRADASLWCWGDNSDGQLGVGDTMDRRAPVPVAAGTRWSQVRMGPLHTCAITTEGALWCWGLNDFGQLGTGDTTSARVPVRVGTGSDWRLVSGGFEHTCAIRADGTLWCWGNNAVAQLGLDGGAPRTSPTRALEGVAALEDVVTGQGHTCAIDASGAVRCWGDNVSGQAALGARAPTRPTPGAACAAR